MLNIRDLQCFVKVYELKSFSRAADALDTVQSQVSARVQRLEQNMATPLFVRLHRGVVPTAKGEVMFQYAQRVLLEVAAMESVAKAEATPKC
ncbi:MAG TPA: LysR family transcriptional regulator [Burkholderiales bacterium]|jgi:LysR family nitrogen assimilation transcriptional regulator|nr:LysR family transcriptional regulator [Burkholderiales bacterium]